jgi:5-methylthioribose kinase
VPGLVGDVEKNKRLGMFLKKFIDDTNHRNDQMRDYLVNQTEQVSSISKKQL